MKNTLLFLCAMFYLLDAFSQKDSSIAYYQKGIKEKDEIRIKKELKILMTKESTLSQKEANLPDDPKLLQKCMNEVKKSRGI